MGGGGDGGEVGKYKTEVVVTSDNAAGEEAASLPRHGHHPCKACQRPVEP